MKHDVIVIGSGLGGLECAFLLAKSGLDVLVLEQNARPGGCLQSYRRGSLELDTGFHYVGGLCEGQSLHAAFRCLGLLNLPWKRLNEDAFDLVTVGKHTFPHAEGYDNFARTLAEYFPKERTSLTKYTELLRKTADIQLSALSGDTAGQKLTARLMATNAWQYLNETFADPMLIDVISGTSIKTELRKESLPLFTFLHGNGSFIESSWRLRGPSSLISDTLIAGIQANGGRVECNAKVVELMECDGSLCCAVCSDGEKHEGRLFISDIHPAQTCHLVSQSGLIRNVYRRRMDSLENTSGMFTVSLCFEPDKVRYFNFNRYVYRKPDVWTLGENNQPVNGLLISCKTPADGSPYTRCVDLLTPMSWGECLPYVGQNGNSRGAEYKEMKYKKAAECVQLATSCMPELAGSSHIYTSSPLTWSRFTGTPEGSAYGVRKDFSNSLMTFMSPRTPVPNLLMTGQSLMLHGVHGVTMAALHTCGEVLGHRKVLDLIGN